MANVFSPDFEPTSEQPGFSYRRARVGRQVGSEHLGASLYELPPRQASFPYHFHLGNEELLLVLAGEPHLRSPGGWHRLKEGEVVSFPRGEGGAHQVVNRSGELVRFLVISEMNAPDVSLYPDSGKVGALARPPGGPRSEEEPLFAFFRLTDSCGYWQDETPPSLT